MLGWRVIPGIQIGDFTLSPHGIGIAVGVFIGALVMARRARRRGFPEEQVWTAVEIGVVSAIIGARTGYVIGHSDQFSSPLEWLFIWQGGISLVGGLIGAFLAVYIYARRKNISFFDLGDLASVGLAIGIAVGRIGDLLIGDHLGKQTSGWWGWRHLGGELISPPPCVTPEGARVYETPTGCLQHADPPGSIAVHQTAVYDMLWCLVILSILLLIEKRPRQRGFLMFSWAALYATGRIATDFARVDKHWFGLGLTGSQLTSIVVVLACLFMLAKLKTGPSIETGAATATYALESNEAAEEEVGVSSEASVGGTESEVTTEAPAGEDPEDQRKLWTSVDADQFGTEEEPQPDDTSSRDPEIPPDPWDEPMVAPYEPVPWVPARDPDTQIPEVEWPEPDADELPSPQPPDDKDGSP